MFGASDSHVSAFESSLPVEWLGGQNTFNNDDTWEQRGGGELFLLLSYNRRQMQNKGGKDNYTRWDIRNCSSFQYTAIVTSTNSHFNGSV